MPAYRDKARGTWYAKISRTDPVTGERKQILKRGFPTKKEALLWESEQNLEKTTQTSITFREMNERHIEYKNPPKQWSKPIIILFRYLFLQSALLPLKK